MFCITYCFKIICHGMLKTPLYIVEYINQFYERFSLLNLLMMLNTTNNNYIMVLPWQKPEHLRQRFDVTQVGTIDVLSVPVFALDL